MRAIAPALPVYPHTAVPVTVLGADQHRDPRLGVTPCPAAVLGYPQGWRLMAARGHGQNSCPLTHSAHLSRRALSPVPPQGT